MLAQQAGGIDGGLATRLRNLVLLDDATVLRERHASLQERHIELHSAHSVMRGRVLELHGRLAAMELEMEGAIE